MVAAACGESASKAAGGRAPSWTRVDGEEGQTRLCVWFVGHAIMWLRECGVVCFVSAKTCHDPESSLALARRRRLSETPRGVGRFSKLFNRCHYTYYTTIRGMPEEVETALI